MNAGKIFANTSAILATAAIALEANTMGMKKSVKNAKLEGAKDTIQDTIGLSKMNYPSPMYNETKKGIFKFKTPNPVMDAVHTVSGYIKGFLNGVSHHLPTLGFAALTLATRGTNKAAKVIRSIGVIGVGITAAIDFIRNGTSIFENKKYLD